LTNLLAYARLVAAYNFVHLKELKEKGGYMGHSAGSGDKLARGAVRASYLVSETSITDKDWKRMFPKKAEEKKAVYLFKCPVHGTFESQREFFISGGYPQLDEYTVGKCLVENCGEKSEYAGFQPVS